MPLETLYERAQRIMRYLHNNPDTVDHIGKALDIPVSTVRKTIYRDFPQCFDRDIRGRNLVTLSGSWPYNIQFELEPDKPKPEQSSETQSEHKKFPAKKLAEVELDANHAYTWPSLNLQQLGKWIGRGVPKEELDDYWKFLNRVRLYYLLATMARATDPAKELNQMIDDPHQLNDPQKYMIQHMIQRKAQKSA